MSKITTSAEVELRKQQWVERFRDLFPAEGNMYCTTEYVHIRPRPSFCTVCTYTVHCSKSSFNFLHFYWDCGIVALSKNTVIHQQFAIASGNMFFYDPQKASKILFSKHLYAGSRQKSKFFRLIFLVSFL